MVEFVYIYIHESCQFFNINVQNFCKEKDLEVCGNKLYLPNCTVGILNIYRYPSGNFEYIQGVTGGTDQTMGGCSLC
jgi:hypothetical protein